MCNFAPVNKALKPYLDLKNQYALIAADMLKYLER